MKLGERYLMPDGSSTFTDLSYAFASLETKIAEALEEAITASADNAARSFSDAIAAHAGIAIFFSNGAGVGLEELTILGPEIGALFIGAEIDDDGDVLYGKLYCRTGFGTGRQFLIETQLVPVANREMITGRLDLFLNGAELALASQDVHVTRAIPSASLRAMTAPADDIAARTNSKSITRMSRYLKAGIAGFGVLVLLVGAVLVHGMHRKPADHGVAMLPDLQISNKMPAIGQVARDQASSGAGIGGVTIELGGFGSTKGPDLQSFGIRPGPEVANEVGSGS
jgi:hypothetical protein